MMEPQDFLCRLGFPPEAVDAVLELMSKSSDTLEKLSPTMPKEALCRALPELDQQLATVLLFLAAKFATPELIELSLCLLDCGAPVVPLGSNGW